MKVIKAIAKNFIHLAIGQGIAGLLYLLALVQLARGLGPAGFGAFSFTEAIFMFFLILVNLGVDYIGIREVARQPNQRYHYAGIVIPVKFFLGLISFILLVIFSMILPKPTEIKLLIVLFGLALLPAGLMLDWFLQGQQKMSIVARGMIIREASFLAGIALARFFGLSLIAAGIIFFIARLINSLVLVIFVSRESGRLPLKIDWPAQKQLLKDAWPLGAALIAGWVICYFDTALLVILKGEYEAGLFNASYKPVFVIIMVSITYYKAIFPQMSISNQVSGEKLAGLVEGSIKLMATVWVPVVIAGIYLARPLLRVIYGGEFTAGAGALSWLLLSSLFMSINGAYQQGLVSADSQKNIGIVAGILISSNIALNFALIPYYGIIGAAIAKLSSDLIAMPFYHYFLRPKARVRLVRSIRPHIVAGLMMAIFLFRLNLNIYVFLKIIISFIIYFLVLIIFGAGNYLKDLRKYKAKL